MIAPHTTAKDLRAIERTLASHPELVTTRFGSAPGQSDRESAARCGIYYELGPARRLPLPRTGQHTTVTRVGVEEPRLARLAIGDARPAFALGREISNRDVKRPA